MYRTAMYFTDAKHQDFPYFFDKFGYETQDERKAITFPSAEEAEDYLLDQMVGSDHYYDNMGYAIEKYDEDSKEWIDLTSEDAD